MKTYVKLLTTALLFWGVVGAQTAAAETILVLVNKNNPVTEMSTEEIKSIYSGTKRFWDDGSKIKPLHMPPESMEKEAFITSVFKVSMSQYKLFWLSQKQTTGQTEPLSLHVSYPILNILSRKKEAIGYVSARDYENLSDGIKTNLKTVKTLN